MHVHDGIGTCAGRAVGAQMENMAFAFPVAAGQSACSFEEGIQTPAFLDLFGVDSVGPIP